MVEIAERLLAASRRLHFSGLIALSGMIFLDNAGWFGAAGLRLLRIGNSGPFFPNLIYIGRSAWDVLQQLNGEVFAGGLVISNAPTLSY